VTASLPGQVQAVFDRFITTEYTTIDAAGQPITWPVTPYYTTGAPCIDVTTGIGYPKKAGDARANPKVALLFSEPYGSGLASPPIVLVQGCAQVDDVDLEANRERYARESLEKLPATAKLHPPAPIQKLMGWYYTRIYVHVRPERVYVWEGGDIGTQPQLFDTHMEEIRSGHSEEPESFHAQPAGGATAWDERMTELGQRYRTAVLSIVSPDGFPFAVRVPVSVDHAARQIRLEAEPVGVPLQPGLACLTAHAHGEHFTWQENFQVRGDLVATDAGWAIVPHRLVGGFELPRSRIEMFKSNARKVRRFGHIAKQELAKRS
jgi:hypothetical protein